MQANIDALTMPASAYRDPQIWEQERASIFLREWVPVARIHDVPEPGSYLAIDVAGEPVLIVRDKDGTIHALSNVCRHRGMLLAKGAGKSSRIVCPYHLWTYGLDGALIGAPSMEGSQRFSKADCRLPRFAVEIWAGWVMVNMAPEPVPLAPRLSELAERLPLGVSDYVVADSIPYAAPVNWKIIVENFSESYHHIGPHQQSLNPIWPGQLSDPQPTNGNYSELRHSVDASFGTFTAITVFPTLMFAVQEPLPWIVWFDLRMRGVADCEVVLRIMVPPEIATNADFIAQARATLQAIQEEDMTIYHDVQAGIQSRFFTAGALSPLEQPLQLFHRWIGDRMTEL